MDAQQLRRDPLLARVRGLIVDEIGKRCGQIPDIHPRLLEGIESAALLITGEMRQAGVETTEPVVNSKGQCWNCHYLLEHKPAYWCQNPEHGKSGDKDCTSVGFSGEGRCIERAMANGKCPEHGGSDG